MKPKEFEFSPIVLKVLRETSGYDVEEIAKKLRVKIEKVIEVEKGESSFTLTQVKKLADIYKRPLAAFFSDSVSELPKLIDYRLNRDKKLSPQVYLAQRKAKYLAEKIKELSGKRSKIPLFSNNLDANELAKELKKYLDIDIMKYKEPEDLLSYYKKLLENELIILIIEYPFGAEDVRAFNISSELSVIVLNEEDKPSIKLFSLFHEIGHLLKNNSGICSLEIEQQSQGIEFFCNCFAAEFLVPSSDFVNEIKNVKTIDDVAINKLTSIYGVSKQVIMIRLLWLGYIDNQKYEEFKKRFDEGRKEKKFGHRNWDKIFLNRIGTLSLREVKKAYHSGKITFYEASSTLGLKANYAEKFLAS